MKMTLSGFVAKYSSEISFSLSYIFLAQTYILLQTISVSSETRSQPNVWGARWFERDCRVDPGCLNVHIGLSPEFFQRMHLLHSRHIWTLEEKGHNFILFIEDNHIFLTYEFFKQHSCYIANKEKTEPVIHMHLHGSLVKWISEF